MNAIDQRRGMRGSILPTAAALAAGAAISAASPAFAQDMQRMPGMQHGQAPAGQPNTPSPQQPSAQGDDQHGAGSGEGAIPDMPMNMPGMEMTPGMAAMAGSLGRYSMMRDASGTAWQPDSTPMEGLHWEAGGWTGMVHGFADLVYDHQGGPRGDNQTFSESMLMIMGQRAAGPGTLSLRSMLSLDPSMGKRGYPLLLQTGETANGRDLLIDRQHPHDLFMELSATYSVPVGHASSAFLYVAYPGEPALGPVTFMHRFSGMGSPAAPISHHWLDSTHITYGVVTTGVVHGAWKLEGSAFTGREPDQFRWDFDPIRLDSYSGRLSWNPTSNWAFQASYGFLKSPEQLEPDVNQHRVTASATYNHTLSNGNWQTTLAWGRNNNAPGHRLNAVLLESAAAWGRHTIFGRAETAQKDELFEAPAPLAGRVFRVSEVSLGYVYDIPVAHHLALGVGGVGTVDVVPSAIKPAYGGGPTSFMGFLRVKIR